MGLLLLSSHSESLRDLPAVSIPQWLREQLNQSLEENSSTTGMKLGLKRLNMGI
jgi:hypothetical protein